jgi:hypothetical protein
MPTDFPPQQTVMMNSMSNCRACIIGIPITTWKPRPPMWNRDRKSTQLSYTLWNIYYLLPYLLQLSFHSVAVDLTLVQTKQIRINIHKRNNTKYKIKVSNRCNQLYVFIVYVTSHPTCFGPLLAHHQGCHGLLVYATIWLMQCCCLCVRPRTVAL